MPKIDNYNKVKNVIEANPKLITWVDKKNKTIRIEWEEDHDKWEFVKLDNIDFKNIVSLLKKEICSRPNPLDRIETWECSSLDGSFNQSNFDMLLDARKTQTKKQRSMTNYRSLYELCTKHNVDPSMGKLFLNELKLSKLPGDEPAKKTAELLGLAKFN